MDRDVRDRGGPAPGKLFYWIKQQSPFEGAAAALRLVAIDELGQIEYTRQGALWDDKAWTPDEAVADRLRDAVAEADRGLERRKRELPEKPEPTPPPPSPATRKFLDDGEGWR